jgi:hypothetical protein
VTDSTLRELERQFRSSGSVEDEAAWLGARLRAGELSEERLRLAAYLGDEATLRVTSFEPPANLDALIARAHAGEFGKDVPGRVCLAVGGPFDQGNEYWGKHWDEATALVSRYLLTGEGTAELERFFIRCFDGLDERGQPGAGRDLTSAEMIEASGAVETHRLRGPTPLGGLIETARRMQGADDSTLTALIRDALVPWLLGYSDPVRERIAKRSDVEPEDLR